MQKREDDVCALRKPVLLLFFAVFLAGECVRKVIAHEVGILPQKGDIVDARLQKSTHFLFRERERIQKLIARLHHLSVEEAA